MSGTRIFGRSVAKFISILNLAYDTSLNSSWMVYVLRPPCFWQLTKYFLHLDLCIGEGQNRPRLRLLIK